MESLLLAYLKLHSPNNAFRFASTTKYLFEEEACVIATRNIPAGEVIGNLEGRRVCLSEVEHEHLVKEGKNFSVIDKTHYSSVTLLIASACVLNHSCEPNVELQVLGEWSEVKIIAICHINKSDEMTMSYGGGYFGERNEDCRCDLCYNKRAAKRGYVK